MPGGEYEFAVRAVNIIGTGSDSPLLRMIAGQAPSAPAAPTAVKVDGSSLSFAWQPPFDNGGAAISYYDISIERESDGLVSNFTSSALTYDFSSNPALLPGHSYTVKVRAQNYITSSNLATSPFSPSARFQTSYIPKAAPSLSISARNRTSATLNWSLLSSQEEQGYAIGSPEYSL